MLVTGNSQFVYLAPAPRAAFGGLVRRFGHSEATAPVPALHIVMATVSDLATLTAAVAKLTKSVEETNAENVEMKNDLNSFYLMWAGARVVAARAHRKDEWC